MIVQEDGTGVTGANSYITVAIADAYHSARGNATWTETSTSPDQGKSAAIVRAAQALDARYRRRFAGYRTHARAQNLEWPRTLVYDLDQNLIPENAIPQEILDAQCELALRELVEAGSTLPDLERGGSIKMLKAGSVEIQYGGNATAGTVFQLVDGILASLLGVAPAAFVGASLRG